MDKGMAGPSKKTRKARVPQEKKAAVTFTQGK